MLQRMAESLINRETVKASPDPSVFLFSSGLNLSAGKPLNAGHALHEYAEQLVRGSNRARIPLETRIPEGEDIDTAREMEDALEMHAKKMKRAVRAIENSASMQDLLGMLKSEERDKFQSENTQAHVVPALFAFGKYRRWLRRNPNATPAERKTRSERIFHTANQRYSKFIGHDSKHPLMLKPEFFDELSRTSLSDILRTEEIHQTLVARSLKERAASLSEDILGGRNVPSAWKAIENAVALHLPDGYEADLMHEMFQKLWPGLLAGRYLKDYLEALKAGNRKTE